MTKLTFNILLSLIIQAKKTGRGRMGNGRILVNLLMIASDYDKREKTQERSILRKFNDEQGKSDAYHKIDKLVGRFLPEGKYYPYKKFTFKELEKSTKNSVEYKIKLTQMSKLCDELFTYENAVRLTETLLEIVRNDSHIDKLLYGGELISKEDFFGSPAHPKQICLEALILALIYYTHINHGEADSKNYCLRERDIYTKIRTVRYRNEDSLRIDMPVKLEDSLRESSARRFDNDYIDSLYHEELRCDNKTIEVLPKNENLFIYGSGGVGKTTILRREIHKNNSDERVRFFISLNKYRYEVHDKFRDESCSIPVSILLKYHYQNECKTYEACSVCEGEEVLLKQLCELDKLFKENAFGGITKYVLLLDGMNEMSTEMQNKFLRELQWLIDEWKNVQFIISGRNTVENSVLRDFERIEACGVSDDEVEKVLSNKKDYDKIRSNSKLMELLKNPLFLRIYDSICDGDFVPTRGRILDSYISQMGTSMLGNKISDSQQHLIYFAMNYALPLAAKLMTDRWSFELDRGTIAESVEKAIEKYLFNERVYQNYIAPKNLNRNYIIESKVTFDIVEYILENSCIMKASESEPHIVHFVHQYYRDYFAAKHIINLLEATVCIAPFDIDAQKAFFNENELGELWFRDSDEDIYRLVGELAGDYDDEDSYRSALLESVLDMSRKFGTFRATENVIRSMSLAGDGIITGVDFSIVSIPPEIPANVKFRDCDFSKSRVYLLEVCENFEELKKALPPEELDHFKDCDFTGADFFVSENYREILIELGAEFYD